MKGINTMNKLLENDAKELLGNIDLNWFEGKKVLITGASGLLGINLVALFKYSNINVKCLCLVNSPPTGEFKNLIDSRDLCKDLKDDCYFSIGDYLIDYTKARIRYYQCDLTKTTNITNFGFFDAIFHFATYGQPEKIFTANNMQNQLNTISLNTHIVNMLFKILATNGKFIFLSTSEVYQGLSGLHKEHEIGTSTPEHARACYIEAKRCGEAICNIYKQNGYDVKVIRLCLAYGIGVKKTDNRVLNNFFHKGLIDKEIYLRDSGSALRTYCYVSDVLRMILTIMLNGKELIYNVGGDEIISIYELATKIGQLINVPVVVPSIQCGIDGAVQRVSLCMDRYNDEFGKKELITMDEGLKRTKIWWLVQHNIIKWSVCNDE